MAKEKLKPDFENINLGLNPFIGGLTIAITKKRTEVINKFGNEDVLESHLEATVYTKVFMVESAKKQMAELPIRSKELYLYLIHMVSSATDYIWMDRSGYMNQMGIKSLNTYKGAIDGLCAGLYIAPHHKLKNVYWINPHFFFKGSRINKYPERILYRPSGKKEQK